jgi:hypothetical protein
LLRSPHLLHYLQHDRVIEILLWLINNQRRARLVEKRFQERSSLLSDRRICEWNIFGFARPVLKNWQTVDRDE